MTYLDTGILVRALMRDHPQHAECLRCVGNNAISSCHSIAETFNTLTGYFKISNQDASEMVDSLTEEMTFEPISRDDYLTVIREARKRGILGGIIYDALHAQIARRVGVREIITYNITNFRHVAPDIQIALP